jgi:hypothetical protein
MWQAVSIVRIVTDGLERAASDREREDAVSGIDRLEETQLQPLIAEALHRAGLGVWPEQRYPADRIHRRRSQGRRCDLVLTDSITLSPVRALAVADSAADPSKKISERPDAPLPPDAFWLEIKTVAQFTAEGPARDYSPRLLGDVAADVGKMASDPDIRYAGVLLVLFTRDRETARHDLLAWQLRCSEKDLPVFSPAVGGFCLNDRVGNGHATVALFPVVPFR